MAPAPVIRVCEVCERPMAVEELGVDFCAMGFGECWVCPHCWDERPDEVREAFFWRGLSIMLDILAKQAGRSGSRAYSREYDNLVDLLDQFEPVEGQ